MTNNALYEALVSADANIEKANKAAMSVPNNSFLIYEVFRQNQHILSELDQYRDELACYRHELKSMKAVEAISNIIIEPEPVIDSQPLCPSAISQENLFSCEQIKLL